MGLAETLRKTQELMYTGKMNVFEYENVTDSTTGIVSQDYIETIQDEPCRLSYSTVDVNEQNGAGGIVQEIMLYCSPDLAINPGSKIVVTQNGVTTDYQLSGKPAVFISHQEINVKIFRGYA